MKSLIVIIKSIFEPVSAFLFIAIGLLACLFSGIVEYHVLKQFFQIPSEMTSAIPAEFWPFVLVLVLEGSKFTLHFYNSALGKKEAAKAVEQEEHTVSLKRFVGVLKNCLVAVSLVCTVIFSVNVFFGDNGRSAATAWENVNAECDRRLEEERARLEEERGRQRDAVHVSAMAEEYQNTISGLEITITDLNDQMQEAGNRSTREAIQEELEWTREKLASEETKYDAFLQQEYEKIEETINEELEKAETRYGPGGTERMIAESDFEAQAMGDNYYLYTFLKSISNTFLGTGYSRTVYFVFVLVLSVVIALILEACISVSQTLLSLKVSTFMSILGDIPITDKERRTVRFAAWLFFSVSCLLAVYIIAGLCLEVEVGRRQILMVIPVYMMVSVFANSLRASEWMRRQGTLSDNTVWREVLGNLLSMIVTGMFAFAGYVLIGFLVNGDFQYSDMNSLAIAIGGMLAQFFRLNCKEKTEPVQE